MVAKSYERMVVMCEQCKSISGPKFAKMKNNCVLKLLAWASTHDDRLFVQDGDPNQNSAVSKEIMENLGAEMVSILRSIPGINCIEKFFAV